MSPPVPDHDGSAPTCIGRNEANKRAKRSSSGGQRQRALHLLRHDDDDDANLINKRVSETVLCACRGTSHTL